jgi:uncharacterized protein (TIGR02270 family)
MPTRAVPFVIEQHAEELVTLWTIRSNECSAGHVRLRDLARFDERIAAHEDGCVVGEHAALQVLTAELAALSAGRVFALAVAGLDLGDDGTIARCVALAEASPDARRGMTSALGWVESSQLRGIVRDLLNAPSGASRCLGLAACRLHAVDPGAALVGALKDGAHDVRAEAARVAGVLGRIDLMPFPSSTVEEDAACRFWSTSAAVLHGNRGAALDRLAVIAIEIGPNRAKAFRLALQAMSVGDSHGMLVRLGGDSGQKRWRIQGSGIAGDPAYVPWLIGQMAEYETARLAGEAFSLVTGLDLSYSHLDRPQPDDFEPVPNDNPDDPNVHMDPDDGLPWPDPEKVKDWWTKNSGRFQPGTRYFMGQPVTREHCIEVLKTGYQRQRILAAHYLCLLDPGTPLFNTSAPAWRQQKLLAAMK